MLNDPRAAVLPLTAEYTHIPHTPQALDSSSASDKVRKRPKGVYLRQRRGDLGLFALSFEQQQKRRRGDTLYPIPPTVSHMHIMLTPSVSLTKNSACTKYS